LHAPADARHLGIETVHRDHRSAGDPPNGGDTGHPGSAVDPHGATAALALGAAAVLDGAAAELLAQRVQETDPVLDRHRAPVEDERDGLVRGRAKERGTLGSGPCTAQKAGWPELS